MLKLAKRAKEIDWVDGCFVMLRLRVAKDVFDEYIHIDMESLFH